MEWLRRATNLGQVLCIDDAVIVWQLGIQSKSDIISTKKYHSSLKALGTFGNCLRPVLSLGVFKHMHKITHLWNVGPNWSPSCKSILEKTALLHTFVCVQLKSFIIWVRNYLFLKKYVTPEGAVSHNVLYHR